MGGTVIVAQARMSSTRLPGKTLMPLAGIPVIDHVLRRAGAAKLANSVLVATTTDPSDDALVAHLVSNGVAYVRGSLNDVLSRFVLAAEVSQADTVVRITCDCPLIDPSVMDQVIDRYFDEPAVDYCCNTLVRSYPIGMDTEVFSRAALLRAHDEAKEPHEREHVTPYLYQHPSRFRLRNVEAPGWAVRPELRLTLDEVADLEMLGALLGAAGPHATLRQVLDVLDENPEIQEINGQVAHRHVEKPESW